MGFRWIQYPVAIVGVQVQNLDPPLPTPTHNLTTIKTSGCLSFQAYLCLKFWPYSEEFSMALIVLSTLKPILCQSPARSPAPGLPHYSAALSNIQVMLRCMRQTLYQQEEEVMGIPLLYPPSGWHTHPALKAFVSARQCSISDTQQFFAWF